MGAKAPRITLSKPAASMPRGFTEMQMYAGAGSKPVTHGTEWQYMPNKEYMGRRPVSMPRRPRTLSNDIPVDRTRPMITGPAPARPSRRTSYTVPNQRGTRGDRKLWEETIRPATKKQKKKFEENE